MRAVDSLARGTLDESSSVSVGRRELIGGALIGLGALSLAEMGLLRRAYAAPAPDRFDMETDVIVVGGGGAGLAAALSAAEHGARVVLLEKAPVVGGSTVLSIGSFTAACTSIQKAAGISDSFDAHEEDMDKFAGKAAVRNNRTLRRWLVENAPKTLEWLIQQGLEFYGPSPEPPHRVPRMHNVVPNSAAYGQVLSRRAREKGVDIRVETPAVALLVRDGAVVGVQAKRMPSGRLLNIRAERGVVLAAGDYSANNEFRAKFGYTTPYDVPMNPYATGDGHKLGMSVGADVANMDLIGSGTLRLVAPPCAGPHPRIYSFGGILVNRDGRRFGNELGDAPSKVPLQPGGVAFIIFDQVVASKLTGYPNYVSTHPGKAYSSLEDYRGNPSLAEAATIEELAAKKGIDPSGLARTVEAWNASVAQKKDAEFGRTDFAQPIASPPFYCLGPARLVVILNDGGLVVDEQMQVRNVFGEKIPHLYAAGSNGQSGVILSGHGHHLAWAFTSGRAAGASAARGA